MSAPRTVTITPIYPNGPAVTFGIVGSALMQQAAGDTGGWQVVDRPRLVAATQWYDRSPWELDATLLLDAETMFGDPSASIEWWCLYVESWMDKQSSTNQPPVLSIVGPVPGVERQWVVYTCTFEGDDTSEGVLRDPVAGYRTQQKLSLVLYEYNSPLQATVNAPTPALAAQEQLNTQESAQAYILWQVVQGDTLSSIAANLLGNYARWTDIAALNNIRDPNDIVPGQVLKIPIS